MATAITEGRCRAFVFVELPFFSSKRDKAIIIQETAVMRKQNTMFPAVSMRALPEGNLRGSTLLTARLQTMRVTLDKGSKIASAMVVNKESELPADMAA